MNPMTPDLDTQRKVNQLMSRSSWTRTIDIAPDELVPGRIVPKATSTKADWFGPFTVDRPSVFQLLSAGVDVTHLVCISHKSPDDTMYSEGRVRRNEMGRGYCLAVGDYWAYVPLLTGDPAYFTARLSDASSDLPAQNAALDGGGGGGGGVTPVTTINKNAFATAQKNVTVPATAENLASLVVPDGFKLVVKAKNANTGSIWVGTTQANAQNHAVAWELVNGEPIGYYIRNANLLWIDADVAGEGVNITVEQ